MANQFTQPSTPWLTPLTAWTPASGAPIGCEMGDEDGCPNVLTCILWSDAYVKPMFCCATHAEAEIFYHGAVDYTAPLVAS